MHHFSPLFKERDRYGIEDDFFLLRPMKISIKLFDLRGYLAIFWQSATLVDVYV